MRRLATVLSLLALLGGCMHAGAGVEKAPPRSKARATAPQPASQRPTERPRTEPGAASDAQAEQDSGQETGGEMDQGAADLPGDDGRDGPAALEAADDAQDAPAAASTASRPADPNAEARARCERRRGNFTRTPAGAFVCIERTGDGNSVCTASSQCEGACLARSRTCAPVTPLIGCHDVLTASGAQATVCID